MTDFGNLLVVMNEQEKRRLLECIPHLDSQTTWASSASAAKEEAGKLQDLRAVVFDGADESWSEVARELHQQNENLAFLVVQDYSDAGQELAHKDEVPISDVLVKPFDESIVRDRIERALSAKAGRKPDSGAGAPSHPAEA